MIVYVILHYQNINVTKQCIESILNNDANVRIVIVDNASPNGSGNNLKNYYSAYPNIHVLINTNNDGFAKGNNIGYKYAKQLGAKIIVVMNNDVLLSDDFQEGLLKLMKEEDLDLIGPDIITPDGKHQNPLRITRLSNIQIIKEIVLNCFKILYLSRRTLFSKYIANKNKQSNGNKATPLNSHNCILHGSIIVFGSRYVDNENFAFVPATFMYGEEFILGDYTMRKGYRTAYKNDLQVVHLGGASTALNSNMQDKVLFRFKNTTKSLFKQLLLRFTPISKIRDL